ncbi:12105_t:CDS:2, partial [Acaulospora morrowiae]
EDLVVPDSLKEAQLSLRLNISTIRDFIHQVERLKILRDQKLGLSAEVQSKMSRKSEHGLADSEFRRYNELEKKFGLDWEKADVIIDLSDVAQDKQPTVDGDKSMNVDIERASSERHMQVLKIMMEETDLISMDYDDEDNCEFHRRFHYKKHKNYSDHGRNTKKQKLTNADSTNIIEHLKRLQNRLSGHVNDLENLTTLITLSGG